MLETTSSNPLVSVHAVRHKDGTISVMLVNKDPTERYNVRVSLAGASARGSANVYRYGVGSTSIAATAPACAVQRSTSRRSPTR